MPADALPIPADLIDLQHACDATATELTAYVDSIDIPGQPRAVWTDEQRDELNRLRRVNLDAVLALHRHPTLVQAREGGSYAQTDRALKQAARGQ